MKDLIKFVRLHTQFFCGQFLIALGAMWLLVEVFLVTLLSGSDPTRNQGLGLFIGLCVVALAFAVLRIISEISSVSFRIRNTSATLNIIFGDVLAQTESAIVVPVNRFFDHTMKSTGDEPPAPVSPRSVHGQAIAQWDSADDFREAVDSDLGRAGHGVAFEEYSDRKIFPHRKYELGTVATVSRSDADGAKALFHFLAMADVEDNHRAQSDLPALVTALTKGWQQIFLRTETTPLVMPLIGSGFGRVELDDEHLLDVMIATIAEFQAREQVPRNEITIVLTEALKGHIKLYNVKREWS